MLEGVVHEWIYKEKYSDKNGPMETYMFEKKELLKYDSRNRFSIRVFNK